MHDAWFVDEESVRKAVGLLGLLEKPVFNCMSNTGEVSLLSIFIFVIANPKHLQI